jgi:hypothetical protein
MTLSKNRSSDPRAEGHRGRRISGRAQSESREDPYKRTAKLHEPTVCPQCGAVYHTGRWQWLPRPEAAETVLCQACHRVNDRYPAGIVTLGGAFLASRRDEVLQLVRHEEEAERRDHPMNRIIGIENEAPDRVVVTTTDIHLPRRIVTAVTSAYGGAKSEDFDQDGYFFRASWHRDA